MSIANSKTRRADPRTAADLAARGFKVVGLPRLGSRGLNESVSEFRRRVPTSYKLIALADETRRGAHWPVHWHGLIVAHAHGTRSEARLPLKRGDGVRRKPLGTYESVVAAAHAILDAQGIR